MDISARAWLIVIGTLLIVAVLLDGYRRMRRSKLGSFKNTPRYEEDVFSTELPNGGARVVGADPDEYYDDGLFDGNSQSDHEPDYQYDGHDQDHVEHKRSIASQSVVRPSTPSAPPRVRQQSANVSSDVDDQIEELYVVNVISRDGGNFHPDFLLQLLLDSDLEFGDMDIFHRYNEKSKQLEFSVANAVEPGYFMIDNMEECMTPGLSFFMTLPGSETPLITYDAMLDCASEIAIQLDADIKDSEHNLLTSQIIMHDRQRIEEYIRRSYRSVT